MINSNKKIVSKFVEITTKTIITYEDGSTKTIEEKENHTYKWNINELIELNHI